MIVTWSDTDQGSRRRGPPRAAPPRRRHRARRRASRLRDRGPGFVKTKNGTMSRSADVSEVLYDLINAARVLDQ